MTLASDAFRYKTGEASDQGSNCTKWAARVPLASIFIVSTCAQNIVPVEQNLNANNN